MRFNYGLHPLKKLFQFLFVIFGCLHLAGGPYSIVQTYAWLNMLVSYSQNGGILQATVDTFSGEKPCAICCKIDAARKSNKDQKERSLPAATFQAKLLQEMLPTQDTILQPPASCDVPSVTFPGLCLPRGLLTDAPPVPPPCRIA